MAYKLVTPNTPSASASASSSPSKPTITRRSANYAPSICDDNFVQSLKSVFKDETYAIHVEKLKDYAKQLLEEETNHAAQIELIETLQRLGVGYLFDKEIKSALNYIKTESGDSTNEVEDLHSVSLKFRLMRQHGYMVPQEIFNNFKDDKGNFKECLLNDIKGILSLYEASYLGLVGEDILDQARAFTISHLRDYLKEKQHYHDHQRRVEHALDLPLHWRVPILEARWFIDVYETEEGTNPKLLELAKLNYNISQSKYQNDLKATSRWWKDLGLARKLHFSRDRLGECFVWATATMALPQYGRSRELLTQAGQIITTVDDVYDVYGTLDELELFTDAVERWDVNAVEQLPDYMKLCFLALFNITNQIAYEILKDQGCNTLPYLRRSWADVCKIYLMEVKWYNTGYTPSSLDEYMSTAYHTVAAPFLLLHTYILITPMISKEILDSFKSSPDLVRWASIVFRLCDDLATSKAEIERGDNPKSIQCYMRETGVSEEDARQHIKGLICEAWKHINKDVILGSSFSIAFVDSVLGMMRMTHSFFHHGDAFGAKHGLASNFFKSFVIEPIPLEK